MNCLFQCILFMFCLLFGRYSSSAACLCFIASTKTLKNNLVLRVGVSKMVSHAVAAL